MAALLLTWLHTPDEFQETAPLEERLSERDTSRLVERIQQMIDREPELEPWLELVLPSAASSGKGEAVKLGVFRCQTVAALSNASYGREADREGTTARESPKKIGEGRGHTITIVVSTIQASPRETGGRSVVSWRFSPVLPQPARRSEGG